jgi:hypothetical protein
MRSLYSSDQCAPGFRLALLCDCGRGGVLLSLTDFRAPTFSLSVARGDGGLEDEFELSMQLFGTYFNWLRWSCWHEPLKTRSLPRRVLYSMPCSEYRIIDRAIVQELR